MPLNPNRNVTFISTSDSHIRTVERPGNNEWDHETIDEMNKVTEMKWPESLGGDAFEKPRGVMCLGDCIDDGDMMKNGKNWSEEQYEHLAQGVRLRRHRRSREVPGLRGLGQPRRPAHRQGKVLQLPGPFEDSGTRSASRRA